MSDVGRYWEAIEHQAAAVRHWGNEFTRRANVGWTPDYFDMYEALQHAEPFYVTSEILFLLHVMGETFPSSPILPENLPVPRGFVWFERPVDGLTGFLWWPGLNIDRSGPSTHAVFIADVEKSLEASGIEIFRQIPNFKPSPYGAESFLNSPPEDHWDDFEASDPQEAAHERLLGQRRLFATFVAFLQQPFTLSKSRGFQQASRGVRRRMEREHPEARVRVVLLRETSRRTIADEAGEGSSPEVRFPVRGHWHQYWLGKANERRRLELRWVETYVKGPEGAPLRDPQRLFAVAR